MKNDHMKILREFAKRVRSVYPAARIWVFGSYVRGSGRADSDLDICVVLPKVQPDDRFAISDIAWEVSLMHDKHLSTVVIPESDFNEGPLSVSPLLDAVRSEGEMV